MSFQLLPYEMQAEVTKYLPLEDLRCYRLVNRLWNAIGTSSCRRRHISLDLNWELDNKRHQKWPKLLKICESSRNLPSSACTLCLGKPPGYRTGKCFDSMTSNQLKKFLKVVGIHMQKLTICGNSVEDMMTVLEGMPNLEELVIKQNKFDDFWMDELHSLPKEEENPISFQLTRVKILHLHIIATLSNVQFLVFVVSHISEMGLRDLRVSFYAPLDTAVVDQVASLITSISTKSTSHLKISVKFHGINLSRTMEVLRLLMTHDLKVVEFDIGNISTPYVSQFGDPKFFRPLETFLALSMEHLTHLALRLGDMTWRHPTGFERLAIPPLPRLRILNLNMNNSLSIPTERFAMAPFTTNQFPVLEQVQMSSWSARNLQGNIGMFDSAQFDSVRILSYVTRSSNPMTTDWGKIFPGLQRLELVSYHPKVKVNEGSDVFKSLLELNPLSLCLVGFDKMSERCRTQLRARHTFLTFTDLRSEPNRF